MQISSCVVHESGALLLEAGDGDMLDFLLRRRTLPRTSPSGAYRAPPAQAPAPDGAAGVPCQPPTPTPGGDADMAGVGGAACPSLCILTAPNPQSPGRMHGSCPLR